MKALLLIIIASTRTYPVEVVDCYDGDTCTVNIILETKSQYIGMDTEIVTLVKVKNKKLRLCDINTPEIRSENKEEAILARDMLLKWIRSARYVEIMVPQKKDCNESCDMHGKYGRILSYLIADGSNLNKKLVDAGLATPYKERCQ